jgi:hypothetical protein
LAELAERWPELRSHVAFWPVASPAVVQQFGRDRVESGHRADIVDLSKMTRSGLDRLDRHVSGPTLERMRIAGQGARHKAAATKWVILGSPFWWKPSTTSCTTRSKETLACVSCLRPARQACCPAASRIRCAISSGWEISERWLAFTSIVLAPIRLAMNRSRSGLIVRSSIDTA